MTRRGYGATYGERDAPDAKKQHSERNIHTLTGKDRMEPREAKARLKQVTDEAIGVGSTFVEATLEPREYYVYTEVWTITAEQLDRIREKVAVTAITVDGGRIMLTAKI